MYSVLSRDREPQATEGRNRQKIKYSLDELVKRGVLSGVNTEFRTQTSVLSIHIRP
jgi:hypothetical protein